MIDNGARFIASSFKDELGVVASQDEWRMLWEAVMLKLPAKSEERLLSIGRLYEKGLDAFIKNRDYSKEQQRNVRAYACEQWWGVVSNYCRSTGRMDIRRIYNEIPCLSTMRPNTVVYLKHQLKSAFRLAGR